MPSYKYDVYIDGDVVYTCYSESQCNSYTAMLDRSGMKYQVVKTELKYN